MISSLGCTVQLQINNTRKAWRVSVGPLRAVLKDLLASKDSLKAETQNITKSFEDLDDQVNSETGYTLENSMGLEGTARGGEMYRAVPSRYHLSTQKMYELKTKLRCSCEGRAGHRLGPGLQVGAGASPAPCPFLQMWWTRPSSAASAGLTRNTNSACSASGFRCSTTCSACP